MILYGSKGNKINFIKCKQPTLNRNFGRTWEDLWLFINDVEFKTYIDTTWGTNFYFKYMGEWYKVNHNDIIPGEHLTTKNNFKL